MNGAQEVQNEHILFGLVKRHAKIDYLVDTRRDRFMEETTVVRN